MGQLCKESGGSGLQPTQVRMQNTSISEPACQVLASGRKADIDKPLTSGNAGLPAAVPVRRCGRGPLGVAQRASGGECRARIYRVGMALWYGTPARLDSGEWGVRVNDESLKTGRRLEVEVTTQDGRKWRSFYHVVATDRFGALCAKEKPKKKSKKR